jgi:hypothetical protein
LDGVGHLQQQLPSSGRRVVLNAGIEGRAARLQGRDQHILGVGPAIGAAGAEEDVGRIGGNRRLGLGGRHQDKHERENSDEAQREGPERSAHVATPGF